MSQSILIVGAGPAGMAAALGLHQGGRRFTVVERADRVGGLSRTYRFQEGEHLFLTDNGPHRFFSKNRSLYALIEGLLDERWIEVDRCTRQYIDGKFYDYPVDPLQALRNVGLRRAGHMLRDYASSRVRYGLLRSPIHNFEDHIVAHFGRALGELNMINYTEKIWGIPARTIHPNWAAQRISGLSVRSAVRDLAQRSIDWPRGDRVKSMIDSFYYPDRGCGLIYETIQDRVEQAGNPVHLNSQPTAVHHDGRRVLRVEVDVDGEPVVFEPEHLVESIPIRELLGLMDPAPPAEVQEAVSRLRSRSQVYLFVTLDKPQVSDAQWIYFPEPSVPFGRISEMRNFSEAMSPEGKTSLFIEYFCFRDEPIWSMGADEVLDNALAHLEPMGFVSRHEVRRHYLLRARDIYPIYDLDYQQPLRVVQDYLDGFENLHYIGRPGRFRYNNQDHSLEMGLRSARSILEGRRLDLDAVGAEPEHYEAGSHPEPTAARG